jgi:hypothetical protein
VFRGSVAGTHTFSNMAVVAPDCHQGICDIEEGVAPFTVPMSSFLEGLAGRFVVGAAQANHELSESIVYYRSGIKGHRNLGGVGRGIHLHRRVRWSTEPLVGELRCWHRPIPARHANA